MPRCRPSRTGSGERHALPRRIFPRSLAWLPEQLAQRLAVVVRHGTPRHIGPVTVPRKPESLEDRRGEILGPATIRDGVPCPCIGLAQHRSAPDTTAGEQHALHRTPMIAPGQLGAGERRNLRRSPELTRHHHKGIIEQSPFAQVVEQGRNRPIRRRKQEIAQIRKRGLVGIPALVIAEIDLDEPHPRLDQLASHQQRPSECVPAIAILGCRVGSVDVEGGLHLGIRQQADRHLPVAIHPARGRGLLERSPLSVEAPLQSEPVPKSLEIDRVGKIEADGAEGKVLPFLRAGGVVKP